MLRLIIVLLLCFYSLSVSAAGIDIDKACEERDEQKKALLSKMSTSITEAFLAGQCTGYLQTYYRNSDSVHTFEEITMACSEFVEKKEGLLPFNMSTTLEEAMLAGMCTGAIYKVAKDCDVNERHIQYLVIAKGLKDMSESQAIVHLATTLGCR
jgi:hypothetical protein